MAKKPTMTTAKTATTTVKICLFLLPLIFFLHCSCGERELDFTGHRGCAFTVAILITASGACLFPQETDCQV